MRRKRPLSEQVDPNGRSWSFDSSPAHAASDSADGEEAWPVPKRRAPIAGHKADEDEAMSMIFGTDLFGAFPEPHAVEQEAVSPVHKVDILAAIPEPDALSESDSYDLQGSISRWGLSTALYKYQLEDVAQMIAPGSRGILAEPPGYGKTATCIAAICLLKEEIGLVGNMDWPGASECLWLRAFLAVGKRRESVKLADIGAERFERMVREFGWPHLSQKRGTERTFQVEKILCGSRATLLILPSTLIGQWMSEFRKFVPDFDETWIVERLKKHSDPKLLWSTCNIVVISERTLHQLSKASNLHLLHWKMVIFDDSIRGLHSHFMNDLKNLSLGRLWAVSGTPAQEPKKLLDTLNLITGRRTLAVGPELRNVVLRHWRESLQFQSSFPSLSESVVLIEPSLAEAIIYNAVSLSYRLNRILTNASGPDYLGTQKNASLAKMALNKALSWYDSAGLLQHERELALTSAHAAILAYRNHFEGGTYGDLHLDDQKAANLLDICRILSFDATGFEFREESIDYRKFEMACELADSHLARNEGKALIFFGTDLNGSAFYTYLLSNVNAQRFAWVRDKLFVLPKPSNFEASLAKFRTPDGPKVLLCNVQKVGVGVHLACANFTVFLDLIKNPEMSAQAIRRTWRLGQTYPCRVVQLLLRGSLEHTMHAPPNELSLVEKLDSLQLLKMDEIREASVDVETPALPPQNELFQIEWRILRWLLERFHWPQAPEGFRLQDIASDLGIASDSESRMPLWQEAQYLLSENLVYQTAPRSKRDHAIRIACGDTSMILASCASLMPMPLALPIKAFARKQYDLVPANLVEHGVESPPLPEKRRRLSRIAITIEDYGNHDADNDDDFILDDAPSRRQRLITETDEQEQ